MKLCNECGTEKELEEFSIRNKEKRTRNSRCKSCIRSYGKQHYQNNKFDYIKNSSAQRAKLKAWYFGLKESLSCEHCGEDHPAVLQFHHTNPDEKDLEISTMIRRGMSRAVIEDEIAKCVVLCANCHFKLHYNLRRKA